MDDILKIMDQHLFFTLDFNKERINNYFNSIIESNKLEFGLNEESQIINEKVFSERVKKEMRADIEIMLRNVERLLAWVNVVESKENKDKANELIIQIQEYFPTIDLDEIIKHLKETYKNPN